jgi:hypothetical protein
MIIELRRKAGDANDFLNPETSTVQAPRRVHLGGQLGRELLTVLTVD